MKKLSTLFLIILTASCFKISAQITLENCYNTSQTNTMFWLTDIGDDNYKYVISKNNGFSLYNLNHSPYLLNFNPPIPLQQSPDFYQIAYITNSLFDCDSSTLEYVILSSSPTPTSGFFIYRTDGTLLFSKIGVGGPYCYGCNSGTVVIRPIENTPSGTKLFLRNAYGDSTWVYSLCAPLPLIIDEHDMKVNYVKVFPNPSNGVINFEINPPNNQEKFKLTIYNSAFELVDETNVNVRNYPLDLNSLSLSSGIYHFDLRTDNKVFQTGKFILTK